MAAKMDNGQRSSGVEFRIREYDNGTRIVIVQEEGNTDKTQSTVCCGARKLSRLFSRDGDGDNILFQMYLFLEKELSTVEMEAVKAGAIAFVKNLKEKK